MLCWKLSKKMSRRSVGVYLNVYDITSINGYAYWLGLGVYHSGVQVHGIEFAFGAHDSPTTGIFEVEPRQNDGFTFRKSIFIGWTEKSIEEVRKVMEELAEKYRGDAYHLITNNCNHFCNDACLKLAGKRIPKWVNRLAKIGLMCNCILPDLSSTKIGHNKIGDKVCEVQKKKLRSRSVRFSNSSSSSSSCSSSPTISATARSRSKGSLPSSSHLTLQS